MPYSSADMRNVEHIQQKSGSSEVRLAASRLGRQFGFSLIELMVALLTFLVLAGFAIPNVVSFIHSSRLQGAANDFSGLLQSARLNAIHDDKYYSTYLITGTPPIAYVDLTNNGGTGATGSDPLVQIPSEVSYIAAGSAPDTSNLKGQFLPSGSTLSVQDGSQSSSPVIFGPNGLPCTALSVTGGTICSSAGGATAVWTFFQDNSTSAYEAVTVTPAGRIQRWRHDSGFWTIL